MVKIEVTANPLAMLSLREALDDLGCPGVTLSEARTSAVVAPEQTYRGGVFASLRHALRLELIIPRRRMEEALELLARAARAEGRGEGQILVLPVGEVVRIRTGERGEDALAG